MAKSDMVAAYKGKNNSRPHQASKLILSAMPVCLKQRPLHAAVDAEPQDGPLTWSQLPAVDQVETPTLQVPPL